MIPAPVTMSPTTIPGSGIVALDGLDVEVVYMFPKSPAAGAVSGGSVSGTSCTGSAGTDSTTCSCGTGSAMTAGGDSTTCSCCTGSRRDPGDDEVVADCSLLASALAHSLEKFPGPHTSTAEAGGAAAR